MRAFAHTPGRRRRRGREGRGKGLESSTDAPPSLPQSMHNSLVCTTTLVEAERVKRVYVTKKTRKKRSLYLIYHLCTLHFFCRSPAGARVKASRSRGSLTVFISAEA